MKYLDCQATNVHDKMISTDLNRDSQFHLWHLKTNDLLIKFFSVKKIFKLFDRISAEWLITESGRG